MLNPRWSTAVFVFFNFKYITAEVKFDIITNKFDKKKIRIGNLKFEITKLFYVIIKFKTNGFQ